MSESEIKNNPLAGIYAEIAGIKMILRAILEGGLPTEKPERWAEIEAMVSLIEANAKRVVIPGAEAEQAQQIVDAAQKLAIDFVRALTPKF
jgi:hypothetical protein